MAVSSLDLVVLPPPLKFVFDWPATSDVGSSQLGYADSRPNRWVNDAEALPFLSRFASAAPTPEMLSVTRMVTRSFTCRARRSPIKPAIHCVSGADAVTGSARAALR